MTLDLFGNKLVETLRNKYLSIPQKIVKNQHLQDEIKTELNEKIEHLRIGSESFTHLCRSGAIVIASAFISSYHEIRLTFAMVAIIPICLAIHFLAEKLNRLLNDIRRAKVARAAAMEKELLLKRERICNDEFLLRITEQLYSAIRYGIMKEAWDGCYSGIITFIVFTAVGCGMLYGGYLLELKIITKQGDIFIVVLSMALLANTTAAIMSQWRGFHDGIVASTFIQNLQLPSLDKPQALQSDEIAIIEPIRTNKTDVSSIEPPGYIYNKPLQKMRFFTSGTNRVLKNTHNDRIFLIFGLVLSVLNGFDLAAYNMIMGQVFAAIREPRLDMIHKLFHTMIIFTCVGFLILIIRIISKSTSRAESM